MRVSAASIICALSLSGGVAFADINFDGGNGVTGPNSLNDNIWAINDDWFVSVGSDLDNQNLIDFEVSSGNNLIGTNTSVGNFWGGDIGGNIDVINPDFGMNYDLDFISAWNSDFQITAFNNLTGPFSENINEIDIDRDVNVDLDNDVNIDNDLNYAFNTGNNLIDSNTCVGDVNTGDVIIDGNVENQAGGFFDGMDFNIPMNDADIDLSNDTTGPNSINDNLVNIDSNYNLDLNNNVNIENDINVAGNTGNNTFGNNTCLGDIQTGSVRLNFNILNSTN
jgi:hypothetical protein